MQKETVTAVCKTQAEFPQVNKETRIKIARYKQ